MVPVQASLRRVDVPFDDADAGMGRRDDIAHPFPRAVGYPRTKEADRDRLFLPPHPHPVPEFGSPGTEDVLRRAGLCTDVTRSRLTTQDSHASRQVWIV